MHLVSGGESTGVWLHSIGSLTIFTSDANEFKMTGELETGCIKLALHAICKVFEHEYIDRRQSRERESELQRTVFTVLQALANVCNCPSFSAPPITEDIAFSQTLTDVATVDEQTVVIACVVVVKLIQVLMDGMRGTGIGIAMVTTG